MQINIEMLPTDMIFYISKFLSITEKKIARETSWSLNSPINLMEIRIKTFDSKIDNLLDGRSYILGRLRLASLCGLNNYSVGEIWSWITFNHNFKKDSLPIIREIGNAIHQNKN